MAVERTLSIIKPDAVAKNVIGKIYSRFESNGLKIVAAKMKHLSREEAEGFYAVHKERPFFAELMKFMTSGPVMVQVLEGENAVAKNRELMGATNPKEAAPGTILDPCRFRRQHRRQRRARFRQLGQCRHRSGLFLRRAGNLPALNQPSCRLPESFKRVETQFSGSL